ncbi:WbuC family cupin fold metalloprotein [Proteus mirabilis]|nr:WbuC family cupin fold metalloprotein [Proteus mirabilis]
MNNKKVFFLSSVALSVMTSSFNLFAQADNTLSVTANRFQQPTSSILAPVTIVDREQIDRWQSNSVLDVLRRMPGIDVAQSGGIGQMSSVFVRGTDSRHVLILIDGVRTNQAGISGSYDMSQLPLSLVQRIEYIRGPRSAVYGSDAIGGVINFITKRQNDGLTLNAGIGSHGYQNYNGSIQQKVGERTTLSAAGGYTYTKGIHATDDSVPVAAPFHDRHGFMNKSYWFGIDHIFNDNFQGYMKGYGYDNRTTYVASYPGNTDQSKTYNRNYEAGIKFSGDSYFSQLITVYSQTKDYNYISTNGRDGKGSSVDNSKQYNVQWGNTFLIPSGMISAGMDWQRQTIEANSASVPHQRTIDNTGLPGTYVRPHRHPHTFELLLPLRGRFVVLNFDDRGTVTHRAILGETCTVLEMAAGTWHAVLSLDTGGIIFEVKHGGYQPVAADDYAHWAPAEGEPGTTELMAWYAQAQVGDSTFAV